MSKFEELQAESATAYQKSRELETRISALKNELGAIIIEKGWNSSEYKETAKKLRATEDTFEDLKTLREAIQSAIKQIKRDERKEYLAELLRRNVEIVERFNRDPPKCPKCGTAEYITMVQIEPTQYNEPSDTRPLRCISFECNRIIPGHRFHLYPSDWEPLMQKIGETAKKALSTVASLL